MTDARGEVQDLEEETASVIGSLVTECVRGNDWSSARPPARGPRAFGRASQGQQSHLGLTRAGRVRKLRSFDDQIAAL